VPSKKQSPTKIKLKKKTLEHHRALTLKPKAQKKFE
jgi:hypothetical protein